MNPYQSRFRLALAALAVLLLAANVAVADERPFHSEATLVPVDSQGNHYIRAGSGQATQLGEFTEINEFKTKGGNPIVFYGVATLTGANGDSLVIAWVNSPVGENHFEGTYLIVGGTGRFEGASGSGTMSVDFHPDDLTTDQVFDGTIDF
jgi:hypothetical protein